MHRRPVLPVEGVTPVGPDTDATTEDVTSVGHVAPSVMSPVGVSQVTFITVGPKVGGVVSPVVVLSAYETKGDLTVARVGRPTEGSTAG